MERYNYREEVKNDIMAWMDNNKIQPKDYDYNRDSAYESLYDTLFNEDAVTGNGSGSYTFSTWRAEENICHNTELLMDAMAEFGCTPSDYCGAEWGDVTIRCYLLGECLNSVLDMLDWENPVEEEENDEEESE